MDNKENSKEDHHRQETAGGSSGRILVKLKFPKMPEEEVKMESPAAAIPERKIGPVSEEAARTHCCRECGRTFSSGKALGGHMSSAHVQANKDLSGKKPMRNKCSKSGGGCSSSLANHICRHCPKSFPSKKSLFGHMRCHPERDWRGMYPPLSLPSGHQKINSDEDEEYSSDDQADSAPHEAAAAHPPQPPTVLIPSLKSWPTAAKRNRGGPIRPASDSPPLSYTSDDKDVALAHELVRMSLVKQIPFKKVGESSVTGSFITDFSDENQLTVFKKQKGDYDFVDRRCKNLRICERNDDDRRLLVPKKMEYCDGKGKEKVSPPSLLQPDVIDSDDETCLIAINDLMNVKHVIESSKAAPPPPPPSPPPPQPAVDIRCSPVIIQESGKSISIATPQKYTCDVCHRSFKSHQALGGHRSSHNKFKFSVVNTDDLGRDGVKIKKETTTHGNGYEQARCNGTKVEDDDSSYVCEVCKKIFTSGQALGGHKRCHSSSSSSPPAEEESTKTATKAVFDFDLNESPPEPENGEASILYYNDAA